jgi:hypothetical protein
MPVEEAGDGTAAIQVLVPDRVGGGVYCMRKKPPPPGIRKSIGDTLFEALMPLHPAPSTRTLAPIANRAVFQSNLTAIRL